MNMNTPEGMQIFKRWIKQTNQFFEDVRYLIDSSKVGPISEEDGKNMHEWCVQIILDKYPKLTEMDIKLMSWHKINFLMQDITGCRVYEFEDGSDTTADGM